MNFKQAKQTIREYFRTAYSDDALAELLDYARAGKLRFHSCCCIAGFPLRPAGWAPLDIDQELGNHREGPHHIGLTANWDALEATFPLLDLVSRAFAEIGYRAGIRYVPDVYRRLIVIPMIKAEIRRRSVTESSVPSELGGAVQPVVRRVD